jgi:flagellar hook assembly protein FlgD
MSKLVSLVVAALLVVSGFVHSEVFASRMKVTNPDGTVFDGKVNDGTGAKIWYYLNDTATAVVVKVVDAGTNSVVATINAANQGISTNPNSVLWNGTGGAANKKYYYTITTTGLVYSDTKFYPFYFQNTTTVPPLITRGIYTRGFGINTNMSSPGFGYWYASCSDGASNDGYKQGTLRYNPDGSFAGTDPDHPMLTQTLGTGNGGTFDWGGGVAPWTVAVDTKGRIYQVSNSGNFVTRMDNDQAVPKIIIRNIKAPRGIYPVGDGANLVLYIAADTVVWRAKIGTNDTLTTALELVGSFGKYVRDVILDDAGKMLVTLRTGELTAPGWVERYDISGTLPKTRSDVGISIETTLGVPVCFDIKHGSNKTSAADDSIYFAVRRTVGSDTTTFGIHQVTNMEEFAPDVKQIYKNSDHPLSAGGNNRQDADIAFDWAGNLVWFENANEEIVSIATPRTGSSVTLTTKSADTISTTGSTAVGRDGHLLTDFSLMQNFPNPFNPSTVIGYTLPAAARVSVTVYDLLGNVVNEVFSGEGQTGYNAVEWNASNRTGAKVASGMYLYRVTALLNDGRAFTDTKRMLLLK